MKAVIIAEPGTVEIIEKERPVPKDGEALLKVLYCGICGADVASFTGNQPFTTYPRIPGHEFSAKIEQIPQNDRGLKAGDVVTCNPYFNCGECYACKKGLVNACVDNQTMGVQRDGSFQDYITMPVERIINGRGLSAKELALIEPFSISCHALSRATVNPGDNLLIVGAGPIGLFALLKAKSMGTRVMVADKLKSRLTAAAQYGADCVVNVDEFAYKTYSFKPKLLWKENMLDETLKSDASFNIFKAENDSARAIISDKTLRIADKLINDAYHKKLEKSDRKEKDELIEKRVSYIKSVEDKHGDVMQIEKEMLDVLGIDN